VDVTLKGLLLAFGRRVRELRQEQGFSQESFADKCGVHRTFMGTIERGESNLSFQNIVKVTEALGVSLSTLFAGLEGATQKRGGAQPAAPPKKRDSRERRS
jgi:transcriptional regulator with XRE-family HTH domain